MVLTISTLARICFVQLSIKRWILSHTFKHDINNDYGIYPENEDEQVAGTSGTSGGEKETNGTYMDFENMENEYDSMYN